MILSDLYDLYELKHKSDPGVIPERFWCRKAVSWEVVVDKDGTPRSVVPLSETDGKASRMLVVPDVQRTSGVRPFFLCDNAEYILGADKKRGKEKQEQFISLHSEVLGDLDDLAAKAVLSLLRMLKEGGRFHILDALAENPKALTVFRLLGDDGFIHEREEIVAVWNSFKQQQESKSEKGVCLVSGASSSLATLFPQVTGLPGAQSSGASLISCNADSFSSYGQKISTVGSISADASDKSGAALAFVLKDRAHRVRLGNDYVAFWTDAADPEIDKDLAFFLDAESLSSGEDEKTLGSIQDALLELRRGNPPVAVPQEVGYHILGIAPYQARLAVRFYESGSLGDLQQNVVQFLKDTEIVGVKPHPLRLYLEQTAVQSEAKNVPSTLVTSCMRSLIHNQPFPRMLMGKILCRMRVDHGSKRAWDTGCRAAILKACLIRSARAKGSDFGHAMERSLTVGLNTENINQGYLLGRLFALLEKAQQDAIGGVNATIRDRFMGAAATTPARVFPQLLKLAQHHISKSEYGGAIDRKIQKVMDVLGDEGFPKTLSFDDQGLFYIGYYQQRQALYSRKVDNSSIDTKEEK